MATTERSTPQRATTDLFEGARRARTLRWLLTLRTAHHLPMPTRIDFGQLDSTTGGSDVLRYLLLELDNDVEITDWATAVNAHHFDEFAVTSATHTWTHVIARTDWCVDGPRVDWHQIQVASNHHYQPWADRTVVTR